MKNEIITILFLSLISLKAYSQEETTESVDVKQLKENVIEAPKIIRKLADAERLYAISYGTHEGYRL